MVGLQLLVGIPIPSRHSVPSCKSVQHCKHLSRVSQGPQALSPDQRLDIPFVALTTISIKRPTVRKKKSESAHRAVQTSSLLPSRFLSSTLLSAFLLIHTSLRFSSPSPLVATQNFQSSFFGSQATRDPCR